MRPRGWLEIRYLDAVPDALWPAVVFTLATLLDTNGAAAAAEAVEPVATAWDIAARIGLGDRHLFEAANRCLAIVNQFAPPEIAESMERLTAMVERGRCPGDEFSESVVRNGIGPRR